jgi:hypothetical protein
MKSQRRSVLAVGGAFRDRTRPSVESGRDGGRFPFVSRAPPHASRGLPGRPDDSGLPERVPRVPRYRLSLAFSCASMSFFSSAGVSFGRSSVIVSLLSLAVSANGTW